jgi:hypothetical protein
MDNLKTINFLPYDPFDKDVERKREAYARMWMASHPVPIKADERVRAFPHRESAEARRVALDDRNANRQRSTDDKRVSRESSSDFSHGAKIAAGAVVHAGLNSARAIASNYAQRDVLNARTVVGGAGQEFRSLYQQKQLDSIAAEKKANESMLNTNMITGALEIAADVGLALL